MSKKRILLPPQFANIWDTHQAFSSSSFSDFLWENGAVPVMVIPSTKMNEDVSDVAQEALDDISGVLLQGGSDIHPHLYGEELVSARDPLLYRDHFEMAIVKECLKQEIPVFAICRGLQLLNVALGGTLHQHLPYDTWKPHWDENYLPLSHTLKLEEGGILQSLLKKSSIEVNSYHHQGIATLGDGLTIEARSSDGLIEAVSCKARRLLGVQWHPEGDFSRPEYGLPLHFWIRDWL